MTAPSTGSGHYLGSPQTPVDIAASQPGWTAGGSGNQVNTVTRAIVTAPTTGLQADEVAAATGSGYQLQDSGTLAAPAGYASWTTLYQLGILK